METTLRSRLFTTANRLTRQNYTRSAAFKTAWQLAKGIATRVSGVTFGSRQEAIERLSRYSPEKVKLSLSREHNNQYDKNAVAIMVSVNGSKPYKIGYVPAILSRIMASIPGIDSEKSVKASIKAIVGGIYGNYYGLKLGLSL